MAQVGAESAMSRTRLPRGVLSEDARQALIEGLVEMALAELRAREDDPDAVVGTENLADSVPVDGCRGRDNQAPRCGDDKWDQCWISGSSGAHCGSGRDSAG